LRDKPSRGVDEVAAFTDPTEALAAVEADPGAWDLVATDYSMPAMSGLEFAQAVSAARPGLPILMMTGWTEDMPRDRVQAAGVRAVLVKPATLEELAAEVRALVKKSAS
jgi:two-component system, cell cycle sensor histidine kinase and response regulator CckA